MSKKRRAVELGKTALIVVLFISALLLLWQTGYYSAIYKGAAVAGDDVLAAGEAGAEGGAVPAAWITSIVVGLDDGTKYAAAYDGDALQETFGMFSAALGEAVGSAGKPLEITEGQWRESVQSGSVFFGMTYAQPLDLLAAWLGTEAQGIAGGYSADMLCLHYSGDVTALCFHSAEDDTFYRCETAVSPSTISTRINEQQSNGAHFAFEDGSYSGLYDYTILTESLPEIKSVSASSPDLSDMRTDLLLSAFGINEYVVSRYTESDGTAVFVDGDMSLRIYGTGELLFRNGAAVAAGAGQDSVLESVGIAYAAVRNSAGQYCGDGTVVFAGIERGENGNLSIFFDYTVNGVAVRFTGLQHAAVVEMTNGAITKAEIRLRTYSAGSDTESVLPTELAAAIVSSKNGGRLFLVYSDTGDGVNCGWVSD